MQTVMPPMSNKKCLPCKINELVERLLGEIPSRTTDLLTTNILDSLALVNLIFELECVFEVSFDYDDLEVNDFRSVQHISTLIKTLKTEQGI